MPVVWGSKLKNKKESQNFIIVGALKIGKEA